MKPGTFKLFVTPEDAETIVQSLTVAEEMARIAGPDRFEEVADLKRRVSTQLGYRKRTIEHYERTAAKAPVPLERPA